jgi:hypothetical protein
MNTKEAIELLGKNLENSDDHIAILKDIFKPLNKAYLTWDEIMIYLDVTDMYLTGREVLYRRDKDEDRANMCSFLRTYLNGGYWADSDGIYCLRKLNYVHPNCNECVFKPDDKACARPMAYCQGVWYKII